MARRAIPSYFYVLVVVPNAGRYLLVQERKHGQTWYLPSGGVELGESLLEAAVRETQEEAGILVSPKGILGVDYQWVVRKSGELCAKWRFIVLAHPCAAEMPKSVPDRHTLGARWVRPEEIPQLPLRSPEVISHIAHVERGGLVMPLEAYVNATAPELLVALYD